MTRVLNVEVGLTNQQAVIERCAEVIEHGPSRVFVGLYASLAVRLARLRPYRAIVQNAFVYPDGMGVRWSLGMQGRRGVERVPTTDLVWPLLDEAAARGWRVLFYGSTPQVVAAAARAATDRVPQLQVVGVVDGYRDLSVAQVRAFEPDLILVGRGAPVQEYWASTVADHLAHVAVFTCGGLFDFMSGRARRAPRWMRRAGLEWLYRVGQEPRRLMVRYLCGNSLFLLWESVRLAFARDHGGEG